MDHFAGLDVSVKETSICIVDDTGRIVREVKVASEPAAPRCCFGATPLVGELPRSNGQTTAWPSAPSRACKGEAKGLIEAVLARPISLPSYPVATGRPRPGHQRPRARKGEATGVMRT
jgi:hypothetical protein